MKERSMEKHGKKGRLLALREYLYQNTDEQHSVTTQKLVEAMAEKGYSGNRKTIKDDVDVLNDFGIDIITNVSKENSFYMGEREFEIPELKLLIDAVSSSRFISSSKSEMLIQKLSAMASIYQKPQLSPRVYTDEHFKASNPQLYYVIDQLLEAIQLKKKVQFQYWEYIADKKKVLRHNGEVYTNSPYACLWNNDFYYLVGYSEKREKVIPFRVDRIVDLTIIEESSVPEPKDFRMADYAQTIIEMYDGELRMVDLICDNSLMKYVIDKFGENIQTKCISEEQFQATIKVAVSKTFYAWCFRFAGQMKIAGPKDVQEEYREMARKILQGE